jgi:hypothetical protein
MAWWRVCPITSGMGDWISLQPWQDGGPAETRRFTAKPAGSVLPAAGSVVMTDW